MLAPTSLKASISNAKPPASRSGFLLASSENMAGKTKFTQSTADIICERIADGKSLRSICSAEDLPATSTVCKWLADIDGFSEQYARAREAQADAIFDEILDIADDSGLDTSVDEHGKPKVDGEAIARARLRVDARKWMAGKLRPKKYGEKLDHTIGGDPDNPVQHSLQVTFVSSSPKD